MSIKEASQAYRAWAKGPHSFRAWFVDCNPSRDGLKIEVIYRADKIDPVQLRLEGTSKFSGYPLEFFPEVTDEPEPAKQRILTMHDARCPICATPCHRCHGK